MSWQTPPAAIIPPLSRNSIHIWRANLDCYSSPPILSADEKSRAERFKFPVHQNRFTAARTILRNLLAKYLHQTPDSLQFEYTEYGKPYLSGAPLWFNLSHSHQWALYAIGLEQNIGVDIEHISADREIAGIAERFFSAYENQLFNQTPAAKKPATFFGIWACKEAFIKAVGEGLSFPLKDFDIHLDQHSAQLLSIYQNKAAAQPWSIVPLDPGKDYAAALAVKIPASDLLRPLQFEYT